MTISLQQLETRYLEHLAGSGYSQQYQKSNAQRLAVFVSFCQSAGAVMCAQVDSALLRSYQIFIGQHQHRGRLLSLAVQSKYLAVVRKLFGWGSQHGYLLRDPSSGLAVARVGKSLPGVILSEFEVFNLLDSQNATGNNLRNKAILELLYATGVRRNELLGLDVSDINFEGREVMVREGKNGYNRLLPVSERALYWLGRYLEFDRSRYPELQNQPHLFYGRSGKRLSSNSMGYIMRQSFARAGMSHRGCHILRHSMATHMLENGADIRYIQCILGHRDLNSTEIYTRVGLAKLRAVHGKTHPAAGLGPLTGGS